MRIGVCTRVRDSVESEATCMGGHHRPIPRPALPLSRSLTLSFYLLALPPSSPSLPAIKAAASNGHTEIVRLLLQHEDVAPSPPSLYLSLCYACQHGHAETVDYLLSLGPLTQLMKTSAKRKQKPQRSSARSSSASPSSSPSISPSSSFSPSPSSFSSTRSPPRPVLITHNRPLFLACRYGWVEVARLLLSQPCINPLQGGAKVLRAASQAGQVEVVDLLLKDGRINPAGLVSRARGGGTRERQREQAWGYDANCLHVSLPVLVPYSLLPPVPLTLRLHLLSVTHSSRPLSLPLTSLAQQNSALREAASAKHMDVVERLLEDRRVDPTSLYASIAQLNDRLREKAELLEIVRRSVAAPVRTKGRCVWDSGTGKTGGGRGALSGSMRGRSAGLSSCQTA